MEINRYLVDGVFLDEETCKKTFGKMNVSDRQIKCLGMLEGEKIVDIGCYAGSFVSKAIEKYPSKNIIGVDYFEDNIRIAHLLLPHLRDRFIKMSVYDLTFEPESIDCITFQEVIEHLEDASRAIKGINLVLKTGGLLILSTNNAYYWKDAMFFGLSELKRHIYKFLRKKKDLGTVIFYEKVEWNRHIYCWTPMTLMTLLKINGFEYVEHYYSTEGHSFFERMFLKIVPFLGQTQILKVRKVSTAQDRVV